MKITLNNISLSKSIIEQNDVRFKLYIQKTYKAIVIFAAFFLLLLIAGLVSANEYSEISSNEIKIYFNLNLLTSLGISGILILLYCLRLINKTKRNFSNAIAEIAMKFQDVTDVSYEFEEHELIIDLQLKTEKINWKLFSKKMYHDDYIFLNYSFNMLDGISIEGRLFSDNDFQAIKQFIDKKVP